MILLAPLSLIEFISQYEFERRGASVSMATSRRLRADLKG